jgi:hypothetical protein
MMNVELEGLITFNIHHSRCANVARQISIENTEHPVAGYMVEAMLAIIGSLLANKGLSVSIQVGTQGAVVSRSNCDRDP